MKKVKSQSGRSMVEMLGVLAIIGVLSVGGIAGYSLSMRRHRANGVVDIVSKYALALYGECQQKLMNGEVSSVTGCGCATPMFFEDAGIGPLPAGVYGMNLDSIVINEKTGNDETIIYVSFKDQKLCQAVASITGSECQGNSVEVNIKQN